MVLRTTGSLSSWPTVLAWRRRYTDSGMAGLVDAPRSGRPRQLDHRQIVATTLKPPRRRSRGDALVEPTARCSSRGRECNDRPCLAGVRRAAVAQWTFEFSTDPELVAKITDVVGLYLAPPENAVVLCVDEKSQIQALDRTQKVLPMQPTQIERRTHDYVRHGTTTLFAALDIATGHVTRACTPRHRHQEFLAFLKQVSRAYPDQELHLVMDNYAAHKRAEVRDWLAANPTDPRPLHAHLRFLVEPGRGLVRGHRQAGHPLRGVPLHEGPQRQNPGLRQRLE